MKPSMLVSLFFFVATFFTGLHAPWAQEVRQPLVTKLFKLEHQSAEAVARAVRYLGSGDRDTKVEHNDAMEAITVRDHGSNVAAIEQAVKQLDVPRPDLVLQIRVLLGTAEGKSDVPADMQKVVRQLEQSLRFRAYHQVAAFTQRVRSGGRVESHGSLQLAPPVIERPSRVGYEVEMRPIVSGGRRGERSIQLRSLFFELESREIGRADIRTDVVVTEGDIVVVGTAALGDRALVLVVSGATF